MVPFVLYADCEALLEPVEDDKNKSCSSSVYQNHHARHIGVKLVSRYPSYLSDNYKQFDGENCMEEFLNYCVDVKCKMDEIMEKNEKFEYNAVNFTNDNAVNYSSSSNCCICEKRLGYKDGYDDGYEKSIYHCSITGKYMGAAHFKCRPKSIHSKLPVIFHNLKGYDSHFIIQTLGLVKKRLDSSTEITIIPTTTEKYLSFSFDNIVFLDSLQFMNSSLASLVDALNKVELKNKGVNGESVFTHFNKEFNGETSDLELLRQKGIFPYDYYSNEAVLNENKLPTIDKFYSKLNEEDAKLEDYVRANLVFDKFNCKNIYDYLSLYLKTDVLLLADVFENFRSMCKNYYDLDPCHYYTAPGFSWDSMLLMTGVKIECFKQGQEDMLNMVKGSIRGGVSMISTRYAKANNPYMESYDKNESTSYISYLDANNLYGWSMVQALPLGGYFWELNPKKYEVNDASEILNLINNSDMGALFEVDLTVPSHLHSYFNDYPLAPASALGEYSPFMSELMNTHNIDINNTVKKLIPNLYDKEKYVVHYRTLQLYIKLGLVVSKVHRVLWFKQTNYLAQYINFNTNKRAESVNDFEKDLFKLFNNSIFGKTCENIENRIECKLYTSSDKFLKSVNKPQFKNFKIYSEGLALVEMSKTQINYNRPMIVGTCILDLSKLLMYDFHYNVMVKKYGTENLSLLMTDTDSLFYHIKTDDVYKDMAENSDSYDFSGYPKNHILFSDKNKKVIGKMKDEANSIPIIEFCGLRSKMYTYIKEGDSACKSVAKGIKRNKIKTLKMENYKAALFGNIKEEIVQKISFNLIRQNNHRINTITQTKISLSGLDNKRYVLSDNINTLSLGHKEAIYN